MAKWGEIKCPRCEELEAELERITWERNRANARAEAKDMRPHLERTKARIEELEAKLAKAVEQLLRAAEQLDAYVGHGYGDEYREAVAELTGGNGQGILDSSGRGQTAGEAGGDIGDPASFEPHMHHTEADRIEELEAKLAKAHLALNYFLLRDPDKPSSWEYTRDRAEQLARTTLAELTGGSDE